MSLRKLPEITLLNGMLGQDFDAALERHQKLGIRLLDLKDSIFGKNFADLTKEEALAARVLIEKRDLEVYTLSSSLCHRDIEQGQEAFQRGVEDELSRVLEVAAIFRPRSIRLLSAWSSRRAEFSDSIAHLDQHHPWIYSVYRQCIDRLFDAGYTVFIENEADRNIFSSVAEIRSFFERLNYRERVKLTWDIQNLWQMGTLPSLEVYEALKDLVGYLHFKGGQGSPEGKLAWASSLADASWPVARIVQRAVEDGNIPVFCLNPSHGEQRSGYDAAAVAEQDVLFLQQLIGKA